MGNFESMPIKIVQSDELLCDECGSNLIRVVLNQADYKEVKRGCYVCFLEEKEKKHFHVAKNLRKHVKELNKAIMIRSAESRKFLERALEAEKRLFNLFQGEDGNGTL